MTTEIRVPTLGESVTEATIGKWFKAEGEAVLADEPLVELETDKVSVEVSAPSAGMLSSISAKEGDTVEVNALLGVIGDGAQQAPASPSATPSAIPPTGSASPAADGERVQIVVPEGGESVTEADIGEWLKAVGDHVAVDDPIVSLETDKAAMDVSAPAAGVVVEIHGAEGDTVAVGALLAVIAVGASAPAPAASAPTPPPSVTPAPVPAANGAMTSSPLSPAPRRVLAEKGIDPAQLSGSGKGGRLTKADALAATPGASVTAPTVSRDTVSRDTGPREERVKMTRLRQTIARRLKQAQDNAAMLTTFNDVDMTAVMDLRKDYKELFEKKHGIKLGFMSFFVKACVHALKEVPDVNAEIDGTDIIYKNHYDIGVAVGTDKGLVVPVIRDADDLSLAGIEGAISDFGRRARDGNLSIAEMQGGTFTISNGGVYGSMMSTPILNPPQSGILGMHRIEQRPVAINGQVVIRPMMYLALSYDHRIVDGKGAVTFLVRVKENLEDPQRLLLDL